MTDEQEHEFDRQRVAEQADEALKLLEEAETIVAAVAGRMRAYGLDGDRAQRCEGHVRTLRAIINDIGDD